MNDIGRGILLGGLLIAISLSGGIYLFGVRPAQTELQTIHRRMDAAREELDSTRKLLSGSQVKWELVSDEIRRLNLFDLREDKHFETSIVNRSNLVLIGLSEIFERNGVAIESLTPLPMEKAIVTVGGAPQAGINRRKYAIRARGHYKGLIAAIEALKQLPPTMEINDYDVAYLATDRQQALVSLDMSLSFNFLLTPPQLEQIRLPESATPSATPNVVGAALSRVRTWIMPPAYAQVPSRPGAKNPKPNYVIPVKKDVVLGRSDPFLPLTPQGSGSAPVSVARSSSQAPSPLRLSLLGVIFSGDALPSALVRLDDQRMSVRPGVKLPNGAEILAIGNDYLLVKHAGAIQRVKLSRGGESLEVAPPSADPIPSPPPLPELDD